MLSKSFGSIWKNFVFSGLTKLFRSRSQLAVVSSKMGYFIIFSRKLHLCFGILNNTIYFFFHLRIGEVPHWGFNDIKHFLCCAISIFLSKFYKLTRKPLFYENIENVWLLNMFFNISILGQKLRNRADKILKTGQNLYHLNESPWASSRSIVAASLFVTIIICPCLSFQSIRSFSRPFSTLSSFSFSSA